MTAVFTNLLNRFELNVEVEGQGSVNTNPDQDVYGDGTQVQLDPTAASGWRFDRWEGDLTGSADPATITMNSDVDITAVFVPLNGAPTADSQTVTTAVNAPFNITLTGSDPDDDPLTFAITDPPDDGTLDDTDLPVVVYRPVAGFTGTDTFQFTVSDGTNTSAPATVTIGVGAAAGFDFYAVYQRLVRDEDLGDEYDGVSSGAMSGDGTKVVFCNGRSKTHRRAYMMNTDGTGLQVFNLPDADPQLTACAISGDGSRAFIAQRGSLMTKIEGGVATLVDYPNNAGMYDEIFCTADGEWVYWLNDWDNGETIWKVRHDGSGMAKVIDHSQVTYDNGFVAYRFAHVSVSDDGATIAFTCNGYWDGAYHARDELFVWKNGAITQLTTDGATRGKSAVAISGDGQTIAFKSTASGDEKIEVIGASGGNRRALAGSGFNFEGLCINYDGSKVFYADTTTNGGRLANTDGSGCLDVMEYLYARSGITLSDDGNRLFFRREYASWPFHFALYTGYFAEPDANPAGPVVEQIAPRSADHVAGRRRRGDDAYRPRQPSERARRDRCRVTRALTRRRDQGRQHRRLSGQVPLATEQRHRRRPGGGRRYLDGNRRARRPDSDRGPANRPHRRAGRERQRGRRRRDRGRGVGPATTTALPANQPPVPGVECWSRPAAG